MSSTQKDMQNQSDIICFSLICYIAVWRVLRFLSSYITGIQGGGWIGLLFPFVSYIIGMALPIVILTLARRPALLAPKKTDVKMILLGLGMALAGFAALHFLDLGVYRLLSLTGTSFSHPRLVLPANAGQLWVYAAVYVAVPAVLDEFLFRGILLSVLDRFGQRFAVVVTALLFAFTSLDLVRMPGLFVLGILLATLVYRGLPIWMVVGLRALVNFLRVLEGLVARPVPGWMSTVFSILLILGIACGLLLAVLHLLAWVQTRRAGSPKSKTDSYQPPLRFFFSIPAISLVVAVIFLSIQALGVF